MPKIELGYNVNVEGARELANLAATQRAVKQAAQESGQVLNDLDKHFRDTAGAAGELARKQDELRRASFKRGETYDPELAEEARIKALGKAHQQLDNQIEQAQIRQLRGVQRINAERAKALRDVGGFGDPGLSGKVNTLFDLKGAEQEAEKTAKLSQLRRLATSPGAGIASLADQATASFGGTAVAVGGVVLAIGAAVKATIDLVRTSAQYGQEIQNTAIRTGLTAQEVQKLSAAAAIVGVNFETIERAGLTLSTALEDPAGSGKKLADALRAAGIATKEFKNGVTEAREPAQVLRDVLQHLADIKDPGKRLEESFKLLPRGAAKELQPLLSDLPALNRLVEQLGVGADKNLIPALSETARKFNELDVAFANFKNKAAAGIAPIIIPFVTTLTNAVNGDLGARADLAATLAGASPVLGLAAFALTGGAGGGKKPVTETLISDQQKERQAKKLADQQKQAEAFAKKFGQTIEGLEARKSKLESDIAVGRKDLSDPTTPIEGRAAQQKSLNANQQELRRVESQLKEAHKHDGDAEKLKNDVEAFEKRGREFELSGLDKINADRDEEIRKLNELQVPLKAKEDAIKRITAAAAAEADQYKDKTEADRLRETLALRDKLIALDTKPGQEGIANQQRLNAATATANAAFRLDKNPEKRDKAISAATDRFAEDDATLRVENRKRAEQQERDLQKLTQEGDQSLEERKLNFNPTGTFDANREAQTAKEIARLKIEGLEAEQKRRAVEIDPDRAADEEALAAAREKNQLALQLLEINQRQVTLNLEHAKQDIQTNADRKIRTVELTSPQGTEAAEAVRIRDIKVAAAKEEYALTQDLRELKEKTNQADFEETEKLIELKKQELEKFKAAAGSLFDDLQGKGARGFSDFLRNTGRNVGRTVFENIAGIGFSAIQKGIPVIPGQTTTDAKGNPQLTLLGKVLAGTPFAAKLDPLKTATDANTTATLANTTAIGALKGGLGAPGAPGAGTAPQTDANGNPIVTVTQVDSQGNPVSDGAEPGPADLAASGQVFSDVSPQGTGGTSASGIGAIGKLLQSPGISTALKAVGAAGAVVGGVLGVKAGIQEGGARGAASAISSGLGTAASLALLAGPAGVPVAAVLGVASLVTGVIKSFLPDPKAQREKQENATLEAAQSAAKSVPTGVALEIDSSGRQIDRNFKGQARVLDQKPQIESYNQVTGIEDLPGTGLFDPGTKGHLISNTAQRLALYGAAPTSGALASPRLAQSPVTININPTIPVNAIDRKGFADHYAEIGDAMTKALQSDHRVRSDILKVVKPS